MLDKNYIRDIADILVEKNLGEIEVTTSGVRITAKNHSGATLPMVEVSAPTSVSVPTNTENETNVQSETEVVADENLYEVTAPLVGTYYKAPAPDTDDFIFIGKKVCKGDTIAIIETMKNMNEIPSPVDGEIYDILVNDKEMVDFGKAIIVIKRG